MTCTAVATGEDEHTILRAAAVGGALYDELRAVAAINPDKGACC